MNISNFKTFYEKVFGTVEELYYSIAPGRANIIGEHTDYNEGYVMPAAVSLVTASVGTKNNSNVVRVFSYNLESYKEFSLENINIDFNAGWEKYIKGVILALKRHGYEISGFNAIINSTVPIGGGLSSSAALEVSILGLIKEIFELKMDQLTMIKITYEGEHDILGIQCGIMDQFISVLGKKHSALFIDTRTLDYEHIPFKSKDIKIVLVDSMVRHEASQILNVRKMECQRAVEIINSKTKFKIKALRDVTPDIFQEIKDILPTTIRKRVEHVVYENQRVLIAKDAIKNGNWKLLRKIMLEGHKSCAELYEVSIPELDFLVEMAYRIDGVIGSRLTGAGLGGNTINLVLKDNIEPFVMKIKKLYLERFKIEPRIIITDPSQGVNYGNIHETNFQDF
ncbi:MAG: galactokinase [Candidatus Asgardarchaeum sp.]